MNALINFDKTAREYSLAHTDELFRFWSAMSQQTVKIKSNEHCIS